MSKLFVVLGLAIAVLVTGCVEWDFSFLERGKRREGDGVVRGIHDDIFSSLAYRDTIAQHAWIEGLRKMRVRGHGIVIGLGRQGSSECPRGLRQRLVQELYKKEAFKHALAGGLSPEQFLDDLDTAIVLVQGEIPAAASKGTQFDLFVRAAPGTQTTSLEGGRLLPCELRVYRDVSDRASIEGRTLAMGRGPIFQNPFSLPAGGRGGGRDATTRTDPRRGQIIGGGTALEDRRLRLVLGQPSYRRAMAIARRINERFAREKTAQAESPSYIRLRIPPNYRDAPGHFLALVRHLYIASDSGFEDRRCRDLAKEIVEESAPHEDIALAWEGIGRTALPTVRKLYSDPRNYVNFHAALAGLRLGDDLAVDAVALHTADPAGPYRLAAIQALGRARQLTRAARPLRELLDDPDPRVRVAAYEALRGRGDGVIEAKRVGGANFILERVPGGRENLIYATRSQDRRIVLFGNVIRCEPPLFYRHPDGSIMLTALEDEPTLTVLRKPRMTEAVSPPIPAAFDLWSLVQMLGKELDVDADGTVHGLGVGYATIVQMLSELCRLRSINAKFMLEQPTTIELFGPLAAPGRPESEV